MQYYITTKVKEHRRKAERKKNIWKYSLPVWETLEWSAWVKSDLDSTSASFVVWLQASLSASCQYSA